MFFCSSTAAILLVGLLFLVPVTAPVDYNPAQTQLMRGVSPALQGIVVYLLTM